MARIRNIGPLWLLSCMLLVSLWGCRDKDKDLLEYDRVLLLSNLADNIIVPAYVELASATDLLSQKQAQFRANPDAGNLDALQDAFAAAYLGWKACEPFEFGPAADLSLRNAINTFPTDSLQIRLNLQAGNWDLNLASNADARGFPALDYLLHGLGSTDAEILLQYNQGSDSSKVQAYLSALVSDVNSLSHNVKNAWINGYSTSFKASLGTDVGSSTSLYVNALNLALENIKTASLGIPLGKQTFDQALPDKVEGLYAGISEELILAEVDVLAAIFQGASSDPENAYGLEEAMISLEADYNGTPLASAIGNQFSVLRSAVVAMPNPLSDAVVNQPANVQIAYNETQKLVILLKTDMASAMSILITYTDADGD
jgi:uncharacterized protein